MINHFQRAQQAHQKGDLTTAEQFYVAALQQSPRHAEAYHCLGLIRSQLGRHPEAVTAIRQAIRLNPVQATYYNNLGLVFAQTQQWQQSLECYTMATQLAPRFAEAWCNLAQTYRQLGNSVKAARLYEKSLKIQPNLVRAAYNLGNLLLEDGKPKSARQWFERAIAIQPTHAEAHNNLGSALDAWNEHELAFQHYQKAVELNPRFVDALTNLGNAHLKRGDYQRGRDLIYQSLVSKQNTGWETLILNHLSPVIFEDNVHIDRFLSQLESTLSEYVSMISESNPYLDFMDSATISKLPNLDLTQLHQLRLEPATGLPYLGRDIQPILESYGRIFQSALADKRIQFNAYFGFSELQSIGFVVTHGHEGVFMKCMSGILNHLDTTRFKVTLICNAPHGKAILKEAITNLTIQYLEIPTRIDQAIEIIAQARFDILHYWEVGTDAQNYFLPYFRLARVQCATWGWPTTTGIPNMDYFISSEGLEIPEADAHYSERLIRLKRLPTYYYRPPVPTQLQGRAAYQLPETGHLYLICQNLRKVHPDFDAILANIAQHDSDAYFVFIHDAHLPISELLKTRLLKVLKINQLYFVSRMEVPQYLNLLAIADVILDTLYYTGGANTSYDAFAVGTPYVTLPTSHHRGRYGAAAYQQIGVTDAIACDTTDYVAIAVRIATDATYRQQLSHQIQQNAYKVFEDIEAVRELENFFKQVF